MKEWSKTIVDAISFIGLVVAGCMIPAGFLGWVSLGKAVTCGVCGAAISYLVSRATDKYFGNPKHEMLIRQLKKFISSPEFNDLAILEEKYGKQLNPFGGLWANLFERLLIDADCFARLYQERIKKLPLFQAIAWYETLKEASEKAKAHMRWSHSYVIEPPQGLGLWLQDVRELTQKHPQECSIRLIWRTYFQTSPNSPPDVFQKLIQYECLPVPQKKFLEDRWHQLVTGPSDDDWQLFDTIWKNLPS